MPARLVVVLAVLAALPVGTSARSTPDEQGRGRCPRLTPAKLRYPARFFPPRLAGAWVPLEARHCLYLVPAGSVTPRPIFHSSGGRALRGPVWAPNGRSIAVAAKVGAGFQVLQLSPTGRIVRRLVGRDFAFTREGALVFQRGDRLLVLEGGRIRRLASKAELAAAAGFPASFWGGLRGAQGYGRGGVAIQWWGERRSVLLLVSRRGVVSPATPVFAPVRTCRVTPPGRRTGACC